MRENKKKAALFMNEKGRGHTSWDETRHVDEICKENLIEDVINIKIVPHMYITSFGREFLFQT